MPDFKGIAKGGWHPSWDAKIDKSNMKNPRAWVGKGGDKTSALERAQNHQSAPLSSLRDPASFAPPPRHLAYYGPDGGDSGASSSSASTQIVPAAPARRYDTDRGGLGGGLSQDTMHAQQEERQLAVQEAEKPKPPPTPYRVDTSGLRTDHLPAPPRRLPGSPSNAASPTQPPRPQPKLPPRLPSRQNSSPGEHTPPPPPAYTETAQSHATLGVNTGALNRLGSAGVSVPGLDIGRSSAPSSPAAAPTNRFQTAGGVSELQSRFKNLSTRGTASPPPPSPGAGQRQAAPAPITASSVSGAYSTFTKARADPSSVSLAEARSAASTANAVNQRYGAQIGAGLKAANSYAGQGQAQGEQGGGSAVSAAGAVHQRYGAQIGAGLKAAGSLSSQSQGLEGQGNNGLGKKAPPPVPLSSKPRF